MGCETDGRVDVRITPQYGLDWRSRKRVCPGAWHCERAPLAELPNDVAVVVNQSTVSAGRPSPVYPWRSLTTAMASSMMASACEISASPCTLEMNQRSYQPGWTYMPRSKSSVWKVP